MENDKVTDPSKTNKDEKYSLKKILSPQNLDPV